MESLERENLASVGKDFVKPEEYAAVLDRLARRNVYAITSFIFGLDHDRPGVAGRTMREIRQWAPGLPVFGQITPYPATPLYERLEREGRLTRPRHWLEFTPFAMAHEPLGMTVAEVQTEVRQAWAGTYSPTENLRALRSIAAAPAPYKISLLIARLFFRGIYFNQKSAWSWLTLLFRNRAAIASVIADVAAWRRSVAAEKARALAAPAASPIPVPERPPAGD
jgi:hypothetical protein